MDSTIRFKRMWRAKPVGTVDTQMGYGVHQLLVQRGIAEFVEAAQEIQPETEPIREPKRRRFHPKESD